jgi:hypothetical protein
VAPIIGLTMVESVSITNRRFFGSMVLDWDQTSVSSNATLRELNSASLFVPCPNSTRLRLAIGLPSGKTWNGMNHISDQDLAAVIYEKRGVC